MHLAEQIQQVADDVCEFPYNEREKQSVDVPYSNLRSLCHRSRGPE